MAGHSLAFDAAMLSRPGKFSQLIQRLLLFLHRHDPAPRAEIEVEALGDAAVLFAFGDGVEAGFAELVLQRGDAAVQLDTAGQLGVAPFIVGAGQLLLRLPVLAAQFPVALVAGIHGEAVLGLGLIGQDVEDQLQGRGLHRQAGGAAGAVAVGQFAIGLGQGRQGAGLGEVLGVQGAARGLGGGAGESRRIVGVVGRQVGRVVRRQGLGRRRRGLAARMAGPALLRRAGADGGLGHVVAGGDGLGVEAGQIVLSDLGPDLGRFDLVAAFFHAGIMGRSLRQAGRRPIFEARDLIFHISRCQGSRASCA